MKKFKKLFKRNSPSSTQEAGQQPEAEPASGVALPPNRIGPHVLVEGQEAQVADVVFVHGLRGHSFDTWTYGFGADAVLWPKELLKDENELGKVRIITWGYDSSAANAIEYASKESIFGHAETLLGDIARLRINKARPIIFVGHSLGGLVIKEALIKSAAYHSFNRHPALAELYSNTKGIVFLGTPHRGSDETSLAELVAKVAKYSFRQPNKQLIGVLAADSDVLENQRDQFITISQNMPIVCIREELPTAVGMIVPESSASFDGFYVQKDSIHANHMDMTKYPNKDDPGYQRTSGHIKRLIKSLQENAAQEIKQRKTDLLKALEFPRMAELDDRLTEKPAYAETFTWITKDDQISPFISWLRGSDSSVFWIGGKAGSGKSTLMKYLTSMSHMHHHDAWANGIPLIIGSFFFYERGGPLKKSREGLLRSLLHQLLSQRPDLIPVVFEKEWADPSWLGDRITHDRKILEWPRLKTAFATLLQHKASALKLCLLIDGLDEYRMIDRMQDYTANELELLYDGDNEDEAAWGKSQWISDGHAEIAKLLSRDISGTNVKICVSSRQLTVFDDAFKPFPRLQLQDLTANDIGTFVRGEILEQDGTGWGTASQQDIALISDEVVSKAEGVFLWVRIVVDLLKQGKCDGDTLDELRARLRSLPSKLGGKKGLYMEMMRNVPLDYRPQASRLFSLVLQQWNSLDLIDLYFAETGAFVSDDPSVRTNGNNLVAVVAPIDLREDAEFDQRREQTNRRLKSRCAGLLEGPSLDAIAHRRTHPERTLTYVSAAEVRFMHQTAKEFLLRDYVWEEIFSSAKKDSFDTNLALLSACVLRLKCSKDILTEGTNKHAFSMRYRYVKDALQYAASAEKVDASKFACFRILDELDFTCTTLFGMKLDQLDENERQWRLGEHWVYGELFESGARQRSDQDDFISFSIEAGLAEYVQHKLECGEMDIRAKSGRPLLSYCTSIRGSGIPMAVFTGGNDAGIGYYLPNPQVVEVLLGHKADPNEMWASLSIWQNFLQFGLEVFASNSRRSKKASGTAVLNLTVREQKRWIEIFRLMLKYKADCESTISWTVKVRKSQPTTVTGNPESMLHKALDGHPEYKEELAELERMLLAAKREPEWENPSRD